MQIWLLLHFNLEIIWWNIGMKSRAVLFDWRQGKIKRWPVRRAAIYESVSELRWCNATWGIFVWNWIYPKFQLSNYIKIRMVVAFYTLEIILVKCLKTWLLITYLKRVLLIQWYRDITLLLFTLGDVWWQVKSFEFQFLSLRRGFDVPVNCVSFNTPTWINGTTRKCFFFPFHSFIRLPWPSYEK